MTIELHIFSSMQVVSELLSRLQSLGIRISLKEEQLHLDAPKSALTEALRKEISTHKQELLQYLKQQQPFHVIDAPLQTMYPVSAAQKRIWFLSQDEDASASYHIATTFCITGKVKQEAVEYAINRLVDHHESLRTTFHWDEEAGLHQMVHAAGTLPVTIYQLDLSKAADPGAATAKALGKWQAQPFDLTNGPLLRIVSCYEGADRYHILFCLHHLIADGWSANILATQWAQLYESYINGEHPVLPLQPFTYKDFSFSQQQYLQTPRAAVERADLLVTFSNSIEPVQLPLKSTKPLIKTYNGDTISIHIGGDIVHPFRVLLQKEGSTTFTGLIALINILLYRYTGQTDIIIGTAVSGREIPGSMDVIGCFANTVALRNSFSDETCFQLLLASVRDNFYRSLENSLYPFDLLIEELKIERDPSRSPLFDIWLAYQEQGTTGYVNDLSIPDAVLQVDKSSVLQQSKFDCSFLFEEDNEGLLFEINYNSDLFDRSFIQRLQQHLIELLKGVTAGPALPIWRLPIISAKERYELIEELNNTVAPLPEYNTLTGLFENTVNEHPDEVVLYEGELSFTRRQVNERANQIASLLIHTYGLQFEDVVAIRMTRSAQMICSLLGILKAGAAYVPIDTECPPERMAYILKNAGAKVLLTDIDVEEDVAGNFYGVIIDYRQLVLENVPVNNPLLGLHANLLAYIIYTSGTSGKPKGVAVEHRGLINRLHWMYKKINWTSQDVILQKTAYTFDVSVGEVFLPICFGGQLALCSKQAAQDPSNIAEACKRYQVTTIHFVPGMYHAFLNYLEKEHISQLRHLRRVYASGEALPPQTVHLHYKKLNIPLYNLYGPTEASIEVTCYETKGTERVIPIGRPIDNCFIYIVDDHLQLVPKGVAGQLAIGGIGVARKYHDLPELTDKCFLPDPFRNGGRRIYLTGDRGRWLEDNNIEYLGRRDDQVKLRGFRIELAEIENAILANENIENVAVILRNDASCDPLLACFYTGSIEPDKLSHWLSAKLPDYMLPAYYKHLVSSPLTTSGKIDKKQLAVIPMEASVEKPVSLTITGQRLAQLWKDVLGRSIAEVSDNFFVNGGDSIKAIRLISKINKQWSLRLQVKDIFLYPRLQDFAVFIEQGNLAGEPVNGYVVQALEKLCASIRTEYAAQLPANCKDVYPLSDIQKGIIYHAMAGAEENLYHCRYTYRFEDPAFEIARFNRALSLLVERHSMLRTGFHITGFKEPVQVVHGFDADKQFASFEDISSLSEKGKTDFLQRFVAFTNSQPFEIKKGIAWHIDVFKLEANTYAIVLRFHHVVMDGWSVASFITALSQLYYTLQYMPHFRPQPLDVSYKDFIIDQISIKGDRTAYDYWKKVLDGSHFHGIPFNKSFSLQPGKGMRQENTFTLLPDQRKAFKAAAARAGMHPKDLLLAAFGLALQCTTGEDDLVWGLVINSRPEREGSDELIGCFLNSVPFRLFVNGDMTIMNYLDAVLQRIRENKPFEKLSLLEIIQDSAGKYTAKDPVFNILFNYVDLHVFQQLHENVHSLPSLSNQVEPTNALFDFRINEDTNKTSITITYNTALHNEEEIKQFGHIYMHLLDQLATAPVYVPLRKLSLLSNENRELFTHQLNNTTIPLPGQTAMELFKERALKEPERIILYCRQQQYTYRWLRTESDKLAKVLVNHFHVNHGDRIALMIHRSEWLIVALLGIWKAGAAYLPVDVAAPADRNNYILEDAGVRFLIADKKMLVPANTQVITTEQLRQEMAEQVLAHVHNPITKADTAYIIYTSGSTGKPKGVAVTHENLLNFVVGMNAALPLNEQDHMLSVTSVSFDISLLELFWTLCRGVSITIQEEPVKIAGYDKYLRRPDIDLSFSLFFFSGDATYSKTAHYQLLFDAARFADQHGFAAIWTPERHFHEFGGLYPNPAITSAALAAVTNKIAIRSGSVVLPLHETIRVAEEWAMVDNFSKGRVGLSIATGWHADDYIFFPGRYSDRRQWLEEQCKELQHLWKGGSVQRRNGAGKDIDLKIYPAPVQQEIPLWITAAGNPETFELAGRLGTKVLTHLLGQDISTLKENISRYKKSLTENGHDATKAGITVMLHTYIGDDLQLVKEQVREPFKNYLRSSAQLLQHLAHSFDVTFTTIDIEDAKEKLVEIAFERHWQHSALIGTPNSCDKIIRDLEKAGVTEIACLVDFGLSSEVVMQGLEKLSVFKENYNHLQSVSEPKQPVTSIQLTPGMLRLMMNDKDSCTFLSSLKYILVGGEPPGDDLPQKVKKLTDASLINMYGPTETTIWSATKPLQPDEPVTAGRLIANTTVVIADQYDRILPPGISGEICIGGKGVAKEYWNKPEITKEKFIPDIFEQTNTVYYRTGDRGYWTSEGELVIQGRIDRQVKINGFRIEPGEIERNLLAIEGMREAVVLVVGEPADKYLVAWYVCSQVFTESEMRSRLRNFLPEYMIPRKFKAVERLPLLVNGKIDALALQKTGASVAKEQSHIQLTEVAAPAAGREKLKQLEKELQLFWEEIFEKKGIGYEENFFTLGGNSMLIVRLFDLVESRYPGAIKIAHFFDKSTIASQALHIYQQLFTEETAEPATYSLLQL